MAGFHRDGHNWLLHSSPLNSHLPYPTRPTLHSKLLTSFLRHLHFLFSTVLVSLDFTCQQQQSTKCDIMFEICCFMPQSAKCVCYDLTPTKTRPYRCLPVNFNLLLLQQMTYNSTTWNLNYPTAPT